MTTWVGLLGVKFSDLQPDVFCTAQDRRFLTSMVMMPSLPNLEGWTYKGWLSQWWRPCQEAVPFSPAPPAGWQNINFQDRLACGKAYTTGQQLW